MPASSPSASWIRWSPTSSEMIPQSGGWLCRFGQECVIGGLYPGGGLEGIWGGDRLGCVEACDPKMSKI